MDADCSDQNPINAQNRPAEPGKDQTMQVLIGLAIVVTLGWPAIKFILSLNYGVFWLIVAILIWRACLK